MAELKYVAAGFLQDAEKLLEDFSERNSKRFSVFADCWRKHSFSLIYMGRGSEEELREFTQEIFYMSAKFITSSCQMRQIGGIYLLYALYRNRILDPPVKIRLVLNQMNKIKRLCDDLSVNEHRCFHYVVSYLVDNALDLVACPKPMGPTLSTKLTEDHKGEDVDSILRFHAGLKKDMTELAKSNILRETGELFVEYAKLKKSLKVPGMVFDMADSLEKYAARLESLVESTSTVNTKKPGSAIESGDIGSRRTELKMKAFGIPAGSKLRPGSKMSNEESNNDESGSDIPINPPYPLKRRILKARRNVGRPKKKVDQTEDDPKDNLDRRRRRRARKVNRKPKSCRYYYSKGEEPERMSYCENLKLASLKLFTDSEEDDPDSSVGFMEEPIPVESGVVDPPEPSTGLSECSNSAVNLEVTDGSNFLEAHPYDFLFE